jgi:hypothetical protein
MNTPTHLAAGALVAQAALATTTGISNRWAKQIVMPATFVGAVFAHLALDEIPHYNWIVYLTWFHSLPFHWLIREAVFALPVVLIALYCGRDRWVLTCFALLGSMYPDLEKVAFVDFHIPKSLVIFRAHSLQLSGHTAGLPQWLLITLELSVLAVLIAGGVAIYRHRRQPKQFA